MQSAIALLPYQQKSFLDRSRFKALFWARGCRKTFTTTLEIVDDCHETEAKGGRTQWIMISRGDRQALENLAEAKRHCKAYSMAASEIVELELWSENLQKTVKGREITLPQGSRILSLPPVPDVIRGYTSNVYLDEFDILPTATQEELWRAAFPVLRGTRRMIISSTGKHKGGRFYRIVEDDQDKVWSVHKIDIFQAVKQGLPFNIEFERKALADEDGWAQEYELKWLDEASAWLSYELITTCEADLEESGETTLDSYPTYIGWDIARRRDLSILWALKKVGDVMVTRQIIRMKGNTFKEQRLELERLIKLYNPRRICVDQTGMGEVIVEQLQDTYGKYYVEGVLFTGAVKQDLAILTKQKFEDRLVRIPSESDIRDSLHSIKKTVTESGNSRFDAERSEATGHGDYFWALALALHAADEGFAPFEFELGEEREDKAIADYGNYYNLRGF
jgi:phage FluMu gp28-like protein